MPELVPLQGSERTELPGAQPAGDLDTSATITSRADAGSVVCYEADDLDPVRHTGWSVIATGLARLVQEPDAIARFEQLLEPWVAGELDQVISIEPRFVTGVRLVGWCR